jgi:hypothetical protein
MDLPAVDVSHIPSSHFPELTNDAMMPRNAYYMMFISGFLKDFMREDQK